MKLLKTATATVKAWKVKYVGSAKEIFLHSLGEWNRERARLATATPAQREDSAEAAYINVIAIIQSSGTGKSRLLYETAADIFTIPINLRLGDGERSSTWLSVSPFHADQVTRASWLPAKGQGARAIL